MKKFVAILVCLVLVSCMGPIQVAKNESEVFKTNYEDPDLARVYKLNEAGLRNIYLRYKNAGVDFYYDGIAIIGLKAPEGNTQDHYVSIKIRPAEIKFDREASEPDKWQVRFRTVMQKEFPKYIPYLKKSDLQLQDVEGLAFGIYWPRRDYTQCDTYGGCIEYAIIYLTLKDAADILDNTRSFSDVAKGSKVVASFNLEPAQNLELED